MDFLLSELSAVEPLSEQHTSLTLIEAARQGDREAWEALCKLYGPMIYRWAAASGLQDADAADVMQATLGSWFRHFGQFRHRGHVGSFRGWLWRVARSRIADLRRQRARHPPGEGGTDAQIRFEGSLAEVEEPPTSVQDDRLLVCRRALEMVRLEFEEQTWRAFERTMIDQADPAAVAIELKVSRWAVYKSRSRVLGRLRQILGSDWERAEDPGAA